MTYDISQVWSNDEWMNAMDPYLQSEPHPNINCIVDIVHGLTNTYLFFQPGMPQEPNVSEKVDSKSNCKSMFLVQCIMNQSRILFNVDLPTLTAFFLILVSLLSLIMHLSHMSKLVNYNRG